ncbi:tol-pal system-associated acyl-CoA thioesterase [Sphingobium lignivorans]|uniref:Acyl-CoA thioester hydrolase n=1 Tax=Sphingobium lignivorans TaxID=2735886 RepID=A0ABR6NDC7_9SPHN|nr:tol-pal system-associated acyl-CoA thioesterase [Sphingobium lignivorans]MBB5984249.1 acyl-CoA thioester hydrolase [Sphingobium lignivorans]
MPTKPEPLPASGFFEGAEHLFPLRVYYEDTDLSGVVYHANFLRYMERARSDMLRVAGIDQRAAVEQGLGHYAVSRADLRYRAPARLDDDLLVRSRLEDVGGARCVIAQTVWRGDVLLAQADVTVAFVDPTGRPRRQPADWIERFNRLRAA